MRRAALLLAFGLLLVAGCGGNGDDEGQANGAGTTEAASTSGETVFADAGCAGCHTLAAAGASGDVGPDLDELQPAADRVEEQVRSGGGGMPAFEDTLSDAEIDAVSQFVADSAGG
jgi:mono/diheme cytochrome c family protein